MKQELAQLKDHEQVTLDLQLENQNLKNQVSTLKESRAQEAQQRKQKEQNAKIGAEKLESIVQMANEELKRAQVRIRQLEQKVKFMDPSATLSSKEKQEAQKQLQNA